MQAQLSTAFSRIVSAANAVNTKALSLSTGLITTNSNVTSLSSSTSTTVTSLSTAIAGAGGAQQRMLVREEQASGTYGGAASAGSNTRTLNTVVYNTITGSSLASNQITLPAGTYWIRAVAPAYAVGVHRLRVIRASDSATLIVGAVGYAPGTAYETAEISAPITLASTTAIYIDHHCASASSLVGLGTCAALSGEIEIFCSVDIIKL